MTEEPDHGQGTWLDDLIIAGFWIGVLILILAMLAIIGIVAS